ncbi:beta-glucosidase [Kibdelosporangium banguiense]|uniref:Beta-glucosidase n=1 Tax=Kibdelosporangium banguiense TaxID=1365924 RepID=A0ABS4TX66_9PSEU|nr:glycoside hydrolase family 3 C-terminal domain-containing protein [Kibdelosporangium banguiense]MBP2328984.1 beta-glucosidase [Kibdelosporangium banguiense]
MNADHHIDATRLISQLALDEKISLISGADFWHTASAGAVPAIMMTDGPHGLRRQAGPGDHLGIGASVPATCFPPAVALGSTFDPELVRRVAAAIGAEAVAQDVGVVLGPGINIKRSPLCGRNFEYFSEDPLVSGELGAAWVRGIQSVGVGASLKHFAAYNQEEDRMRASSDVDERPLREIYLRAFERVVRQAAPWTVMCSYNRINGVYASEDPWLLTSVLRDEWGFTGVVVSDWGAVGDRVKALLAGLDLEMPTSGGRSGADVRRAVEAGVVTEDVVDRSAARVAALASRAANEGTDPTAVDFEQHHALATEVAARSIVLLRNEGDVLPLSSGARLAVIGEFARTPRYQGAGSSRISPTRLDTALEAIRSYARDVVFRPGYSLDKDVDDAFSAQLRNAAVAAARDSDVVVLFLGLPGRDESEGFDRTTMDLPRAQLELVDAVAAASPRTVVVLSNGGVVALPFRDRVAGLMEGWLLGQGGGTATADVLFGKVNPSGRLAETIPLRVQDSPAFLNFPGEFGRVRYGEGLFVGYRWYDARLIEVAYPFGHGLSYTTFHYADANVSALDSGDLVVSIALSNTGAVSGREVVQAYAAPVASRMQRPERELVAFASVELAPGETRRIELPVLRQDLAYWDVRVGRWVVEGGPYRVEVGASSRDLRLSSTVEVRGDDPMVPLSPSSSMGEAMAHPVAGPMLRQAMARNGRTNDDSAESLFEDAEAIQRMTASIPLGRLGSMGAQLGDEELAHLIETANSKPLC